MSIEIPSLLPNVHFLGALRQIGIDSEPDKLKLEDIESGEQLRDFMQDGKSGKAMFFGVTAVSRKGAEVKAEREAKRILYGIEAFNTDMWSAGTSNSYVDEIRLIDPRDAFFKDRPSLSPDEYIVQVSIGFNPW